MEARTQDGYYVWDVAGRAVTVHLHLDVLDRLSAEAMRGFGAVPKRGAEVGGVLIGTVEPGEDGDPTTVRIEDFEPVECEYRRGPSYLFTEDEKATFEDAVLRWQPDPAKPAHAVGFYRSQTRDGMSLSLEDIELLDEFFPDPADVALLIKPYGTKVSAAGFFVRENGAFPDVSPQEFPFRRRELTGEEPPPHRPMMDRVQRPERGPRRRERSYGSRELEANPTPQPLPEIAQPAEYQDPYMQAAPMRASQTGTAYATTLPSRSRFNSSFWIPLSFVFLLFGIALGYMISLMAKGAARGLSDPQDFALGLSVMKSDDNLTVKWDRYAPAIRAALDGVLEIEENGVTKPVALNSTNLQSGTVVVEKPTHSVRFRLTVHPQARLNITETAEWRP
jgi:hypothetical protein